MAELFQSIAALLWPLIVIILIVVLLVMFRPSLRKIIESAKERKFTIKVGNNELTMDEASKQQQNMINDIQSQILELKKMVENKTSNRKTSQVNPLTSSNLQNKSILWVDDNPKNNSYAVQQLNEMRIPYDLALSTNDGLKRYKQNKYGIIISDLGRLENKFMNYTAGFDLFHEIRKDNDSIPFIIFTTSQNVRQYFDTAKQMGVTLITSSWTEILGFILNK